MTVESIMTFRLKKLRATDNVRDALEIMHQQHVRNLPVVNDDDHFIGLFGIRQLIRSLLPKAAQIKGGLQDLSFMPDELGELRDRLTDVGEKPVSDFLEDEDVIRFCRPSTSLPELLELIYQSFDTSLPVIVISGRHRKLEGVVTAWDVLEKLAASVFALDARSGAGPDGAAAIEDATNNAKRPE